MRILIQIFLVTLIGMPTYGVSIYRPPEDEVLYFIMPDRFLDGDPSNNYGGDKEQGSTREDSLRHGYLPTHKGYYHGGDLHGVMMALPYLDDLGITALWLAPIFKNKPVQSDSSSLYGHSAAYHGYWILDFLQVDPHLGTNEDLKELVQQAHARGMKVYLDIVTNHTADVIRLEPWPDRHYERPWAYVSKSTTPYRDRHGQAFDDRIGAPFPSMTEKGFPYRATIVPTEAEAKHPAWLNDPRNYHNRGNSRFAGESSLYGDFFGLDDLFTERPEVVQGMIAIYSHWIQHYGIDGFRIDTARHVNVEFWQAFSPALQQAAQQVSMDHFYAFGEVADGLGRPEVLSYFTTRARLQGVLDFGFQKAARAFVSQGQSPVELATFFSLDDYYTDSDTQVTPMPTFLGNHDMGRFGRFLIQDNPDSDGDALVSRAILAHALMFFSRGTPVIYYGDEQGFTGDGGDKDAREDMFPSQVTVYNDNKLIGTDRTTADLNFNMAHPLYQAMRRMARVYRANTGLRRGAQIFRVVSDATGLYAFSRIDPRDKIEYIVAINNRSQGEVLTDIIPTAGPDRTYDLIYSQPPGSTSRGRSDALGELSVSLPPLGVKVYRAHTPLTAPATLPQLRITHPISNQTLYATHREESGYMMPNRIEVGVALGKPVFGRVSFFSQFDGGADHYLGADHTPPYRIFLDPFPYIGKRLSIKAVYEDTFGGTRAAVVTNLNIQPSLDCALTPTN
jgi:alpha-amylase